MACCKHTKYNLLLQLDPSQRQDHVFQANVVLNLKEAVGWDESRAKTAVEFAAMKGYCLIDSGPSSDMTELSLKLARVRIPHELKLSKK